MSNKGKKRNKRKAPRWSKPLTQGIDPDALNNCYFNLRGEFCTNLETSRSKVAVQLREDRAAKEEAARKRAVEEKRRAHNSPIEKKIVKLEREIRKLERRRDDFIKMALQRTDLDKTSLFKDAALIVPLVAALRKQVNDLKKELR